MTTLNMHPRQPKILFTNMFHFNNSRNPNSIPKGINAFAPSMLFDSSFFSQFYYSVHNFASIHTADHIHGLAAFEDKKYMQRPLFNIVYKPRISCKIGCGKMPSKPSETNLSSDQIKEIEN
jgi:hypothetical protein